MAFIASATDDDAPTAELGHISLNDSADETIVLLHGSGMSHNEWMLVWPHLSDYHILAVDLNGHSSSSEIKPATVPAMAEYVGRLIQKRAHGGTAHVAGMSMGGFVSVELARTRPPLVRSVFATGCAPITGMRLRVARQMSFLGRHNKMPWAVPGWLGDRLDEAVWRWQDFTVPEELRRDMKQKKSPAGKAEAFDSLLEVRMETMEEVSVRTLAVAGGRMDDVEATKRQGQGLRVGCAESGAVVVRQAWHDWVLQFPELCAEGIKAWIECRKLPKEFESLL